ncbi:MAG TPA: GyrI-like domain-containing protein [Gordonibacter urolithinfaciens]|uniref:GyrI-like domain-containing protein n=1 Tax=Gordonibacter urolithinfaciens TaxID=1335613 RepID=UPI001DDDD648|nr:GyrI-like domain-containing protein [Gordonibacter urolithinfaciens]HJF63927.1 GyrI-like domain-containing protein [Gordonibacter urolithinfaciens]
MGAAFDFKKEYKDLYLPKTKPTLIDVPVMTFIAVAGSGNPNEENGDYAEALGLLYAFSFTVKMAKMGDWQPEGYFDYVVPPLEGLWWGGGFDGRRIEDKGALNWVSMIRQPDFVTPEVFAWAREQVAAKKPGLDVGRARLVRFAEGPCAQIMHKGPYDNEPATVAALEEFVRTTGRAGDIADPPSAEALMDMLDADGGVPSVRLHHEIYLGDPRRTKPENLRTVLRHPVKPASA